jgi:hypothetical protein
VKGIEEARNAALPIDVSNGLKVSGPQALLWIQLAVAPQLSLFPEPQLLPLNFSAPKVKSPASIQTYATGVVCENFASIRRKI